MSKKNIKERILQVLENSDSDRVFDKPLSNEMELSFLEYSMSVIKSRALPDYRDGLKPVHRRIIYAAAQEGLTHDKRYKKSAAIVGSVMGSYHPHGDMAIYDSLVRMSQNFRMRYPLIDGQGNFGSIDGDAPAAMRYTEARLSEVCSQFIDGLDEDWVEMVDNYDQSKKEPVVLPTLIPNILVNGSEGIAVGLATKIPPHNLNEVLDAAMALIRNDGLTIKDIYEYIKGPDFPTGGEVLNYSGVKDYFEVDGKRIKSFRLRGKVEVEKENRTKGRIIITEIPYGVRKSSIITQIVSYMNPDDKKSRYIVEFDEYIKGIRDESSIDGIRIVIEYSGCPADVILNNLYKYTRLQISFSASLVVLKDNEPKRLNILDILRLYVAHQLDMLRKKAKYRMDVLNKRIHILEGRLIIVDDVLTAVKIITESDTPEKDLQSKYGLSDEQLKDVMELRVKSLRKLSINDMHDEKERKSEESRWNKELLEDENKQREELIKRLEEVKKKYGDNRRTVINLKSDGYISNEDTKNYQNTLLIYSKNSYLSQIPISSSFFHTFRKNRRSKLSIKPTFYKNDAPKYMLSCNGRDDLLFFTDKGRVYKKKVHEFELKNGLEHRGRLARNYVNYLSKDENVIHVMKLSSQDYANDDLFLVFVTNQGYAKKVHISKFKYVRPTGKKAVNACRGEVSFVLKNTSLDQELILISSPLLNKKKESVNKIVRVSFSDKMQIKFKNDNPENKKNKQSYWNKIMKLEKGQTIMASSTTQEGDLVVSIDSGGFGRAIDLSFRKTKNPSKGVIFYKSSKNECISCVLSKFEDLILYVTDEEKIYKNSVKDLCKSSGSPFKAQARGHQLLSKDLLEGDDPSKVSITYFTKLSSSDLEEIMPEEDFEEESEEKPEVIVE